MKIRAKYIGINKVQPGFKTKVMYRNGRNYTLNFDTESEYSSEKYREYIHVSKFNLSVSDTDLFYKTLKSFVKNWEVQ